MCKRARIPGNDAHALTVAVFPPPPGNISAVSAEVSDGHSCCDFATFVFEISSCEG